LGQATNFFEFSEHFQSNRLLFRLFNGAGSTSRITGLVSVNASDVDPVWLAAGEGDLPEEDTHVWLWRSAFKSGEERLSLR
jgi:hypothetical protein